MEELIIKDFEISVRNSPEAESLFGDTTDDVIAAANKEGFVEKIPILGWIVAYNFPPRDYYLPVAHFPLAAGKLKQTVICKYRGRYDIHIVGVKSNAVERSDVSIMAEAVDKSGKSIWRNIRSSSALFKYFSSRGNREEEYRYFYLTFSAPEDVPCNTPFVLSICCNGAVSELLQHVPNATIEVVKVFDK